MKIQLLSATLAFVAYSSLLAQETTTEDFSFSFANFPSESLPQKTDHFGLHLISGAGYDLQGVEIALLGGNWRTRHVEGFQLGLFYNVAEKQLSGGQLGFVNISENTLGGQFGFVNISENTKGIQNGFVNISGNTTGAQIGFVNISDYHLGIQYGFTNIATKKSSALQIGFVNIAPEGNNGLSLGFLNIIKDGISHTDIYTEYSRKDALAHISMRTGAKYLYTVWDMGYSLEKNKDRWEASFGLGYQWNINDVFYLSTDTSSIIAGEKNINNKDLYEKTGELGIKTRIIADIRPTSSFGIMFGGSFQVRGKGFQYIEKEEEKKEYKEYDFKWDSQRVSTIFTGFVGASLKLW